MAEAKSDRRQALEVAIAQIERQFGKGSIMRLGAGGPLEEIAVIPTGALSLDVALGVGGLPRGRVTEIYGPESSGKTTLGLHVIAEAQRLGGIAAFIDAEHALDPIYAKKLGVNTDELLISQPDTGEQALEIAETLVRSNSGDVIVVDSVAALVPRAELDGDMGDSLPGLQARLMSQALRKLTAAISRSGAILIFINQIREKIGVMFGCFHYNTRVRLADGTSMKIGRIVNHRLPLQVLSWDPDTGKIEPRRITNWFDNGRTDHFIQFEVQGGRSGRRHFAATENHVILAPRGCVRAGDLEIGDEVLVVIKDYRLTDDQAQVILCGSFGDGSFAGSYARWGKGKAVLYNKALTGDSRQRVMEVFERLGVGRPRDDSRGFWFDSEQTARLHVLIAPYVHPSLDYKLHPSQRGRFSWHPSVEAESLVDREYLRTAPARILRKYVKPATHTNHRYDLEVDGHHTYLVDGGAAHVSPETQPGGRALKFYASIRMDIRRLDAIKQGTESLGVRTKVKVVKNKLAPPHREAEFDMIYGEGISKAGTVLDAGVEQSIIEKSGTWYTYKNERIGQGRENAKKWLQENPATLADLEAKIRDALGLRPAALSK